MTQVEFYQHKLQFETDSFDVNEKLDQGANIVVVDARAPEAYALEYIPTAINLHHKKMTAESTAELDQEVLYVTYCDGIGCNASTKGALKMTELGFKVKELMGGLDWWKRDGYATHGTQGVAAREGIHCFCD